MLLTMFLNTITISVLLFSFIASAMIQAGQEMEFLPPREVVAGEDHLNINKMIVEAGGHTVQILDFYQLADVKIRKVAQATAIKVHKDYLFPLNDDDTIRIQRMVPRMNMCLLRNFREQLRVPPWMAGGFLISEDTLVTAGHAMESRDDCSSSSWVFDYAVKSPGENNGR